MTFQGTPFLWGVLSYKTVIERSILMRLLFIGDVVGKAGCDFLEQHIHSIKSRYDIDVVVVNGENAANGNGITRALMQRLYAMGADVITTGNHCFGQRDSTAIYDESETLLRPANYPEGVTGHGFTVVDMGYCKIAVVNLQGVVSMSQHLDNPFSCIDRILPQLDTKNIFIDFHAEATSEKKAMGQYLAGKVTAVMGTHTHVQTADEAILSEHTAYITDVGMTGPELSVLGIESSIAIDKQRFQYPVMFEVSGNPCFVNAVAVEFDERLGRAYKIERIIWR